MIRSSRKAFAAALFAALAGACATADDPCASANAPVSFGMLLSNSLSSNYGACIDTMREDLALAKLRARSMEAKAAQLRSEEQRLRGEQAAAKRRLAELNEQQAQLATAFDSANRERTIERQRLEALLAEERRLADEVERLNRGGRATGEDAAALRARQDRLRAQVRAVAG